MPAAAELSGVIPPILTPTDAQDRVDEAALRRSINRAVLRAAPRERGVDS